MKVNISGVGIPVAIAFAVCLGCWSRCGGFELETSYLDDDRQRLKYGYASAMLVPGWQGEAALPTAAAPADFQSAGKGEKSPLKAFVLSAAVPGLGQFYYGSKLKAGLFAGAEIATWALHIKWHGDGSDQRDAFEQFNRDHWSQTSYSQYLQYAYHVSDDEDVSATEVTHHLPDTRTQQYYEMTGKYDQFAWGWDDAEREGLDLEAYGTAHGEEIAITGPSKTPSSARRLIYEGMRDESNRSFDKASKMIIAAIANRVVSAFEAYFVTKHRNQKSSGKATDGLGEKDRGGEFRFRASLKSYHSRRDTPYVKVTYKF